MINPDRPLTRDEIEELGRIAPDFRRRQVDEARRVPGLVMASGPTAEQIFSAWERVRRVSPRWSSTLRRY